MFARKFLGQDTLEALKVVVSYKASSASGGGETGPTELDAARGASFAADQDEGPQRESG